jgi:Xaa-Pro aminopeptidase
MRATRPGTAEYEVEAELLYAYRRGGGDGPGYEPIVAGGVNATILHYRTGHDALKAGELLLVDSGCEFGGYTADVTRTFKLRSSHPVLATLQPELVTLAPGAEVAIAVQLSPLEEWGPVARSGAEDVLIFLTDEDDIKEAVFKCRVIGGAPAAA